jgi:hypothetical protein
MLATMSPDL